VSKARNFGVEHSRGGWLAFLDSDDEWLPEKLERQWAALQQQPEYRLCHTEEIWIRNGKRVNPMNKHAKYGGHIFDYCLPLCAMSPSSVLIRRDLLEQTGGFDEQLPACEDYDLWLRICAKNPVLFIDQPLLKKYGGHPDQLSKKHWGMDRFRVYALEKILHSGTLDDQQRAAATATLLEKCEILANGASKRGNRERANYYATKLSDFRGLTTEVSSL
jgi:glycosyltransferase involved in cell wall biosynthesis